MPGPHSVKDIRIPPRIRIHAAPAEQDSGIFISYHAGNCSVSSIQKDGISSRGGRSFICARICRASSPSGGFFIHGCDCMRGDFHYRI